MYVKLDMCSDYMSGNIGLMERPMVRACMHACRVVQLEVETFYSLEVEVGLNWMSLEVCWGSEKRNQ